MFISGRENKFLLNFLKQKGFKSIFNSRSDDGKTIFWLNSKQRGIDIVDEQGQKIGEYNMLYREVAINWLLCAVFDHISWWQWHCFQEDKWDGTIISIHGRKIPTEHVMAYDHWGKKVSSSWDMEKFIANTILGKLKKGGSFESGRKYLDWKILVVNAQFRELLAYDVAAIMNLIFLEKPIFLPDMYLVCVQEERSKDFLIFSVTQMRIWSICTFHVHLDLVNENWCVQLFKGISREI